MAQQTGVTSTQEKPGSSLEEKEENTPRSIGHWYIGETIGQGPRSFVKKGYHKDTSQIVALQIIPRTKGCMVNTKAEQVTTRLNTVSEIEHANVTKLLSYNLCDKYQRKGAAQKSSSIDCTLLVYECEQYELFDAMYYVPAFSPILARTYFRQLIFGLEACHSAGVAHGHVTPENLLLDRTFNLKLSDVGTSILKYNPLMPSRGENIVFTAPEVLFSGDVTRMDSFACDVFGAGIILFILCCGYPPFEEAHKNDRWYRPLAKGYYKKFWDRHATCAISNDENCKDLLQRMFACNPNRRITLSEIKKHPWFNGCYLPNDEIARVLGNRYRQMESKRRSDAKKLRDLVPTKICRCNLSMLHWSGKEVPALVPINDTEGVLDVYTTSEAHEVIHKVYECVTIKAQGMADFDFDTGTLYCMIQFQTMHASLTAAAESPKKVIRFKTQVFRSRNFVPDTEDEDEDDQSTVYVVQLRRISGDSLVWKKIVNQLLFKTCADVLTGLPRWARRLQRQMT